MAETVTPAVRGIWKIAITGLQIAAASVSALTVGAGAAFAIRSAGLHASVKLVVFVCVLCAVADSANYRWRHPRPLAVPRQVPQFFGHQRGPWAAASRYAFRMGVGPATILTTWMWWAALMLCGLSGLAASIFGAVVFVSARFTVSALSSFGVTDGTSMASRSRRLDAFSPMVKRMVLVAPWVVAAGVVALDQGFRG